MNPSLIEYVRTGIESRGRRRVFDHKIDSTWPIADPSDRQKQAEEVRAFASANGWSARFAKDGRWVDFRSVASS